MNILDGTTPGKWRVEGSVEVRQVDHSFPHLTGVGRLLVQSVFASVEDLYLIAAAPDLAADNAALRAEVERLKEEVARLEQDKSNMLCEIGVQHKPLKRVREIIAGMKDNYEFLGDSKSGIGTLDEVLRRLEADR